MRTSGILMPVASLPSPYGIGTLGQAARDFVSFLAQAGQTHWQVLPVGPTGFGDSPYQSFSSFAGNPYFIDLELLAEDGLLTPAELEGISWGDDPEQVDYGAIYQNRFPVLRRAYERGWQRDRAAGEGLGGGGGSCANSNLWSNSSLSVRRRGLLPKVISATRFDIW